MAVVVNQSYWTWRTDLLQVVMRAKKEASHSGRHGGSKHQPPSDGFSAASRPPQGGRTGQSAQSVAPASHGGRKLPTNPSGGQREESHEGSRAADQRERSQSRRSKVGPTDAPKPSEPAAPEDEEPQPAKTGLTDRPQVLAEAYADADALTPIFLLITDSVDIPAMVGRLHAKHAQVPGGPEMKTGSLGKGLERKVEGDVLAAARRGDWMILENLHLAEDWLPALEDLLSRLKTGTELNPRFRLWLTSVHCPVIPPYILLKSIKVAIQPPR